MECELCRQRATCTYKMHGKTLQLCDRCFDRYEIQTAYEKRILEIDELIRNGNYEKAFAFLQDILNVYANRDHNGWLENSILSHQGIILAEQGKMTKALEKYRLRSQKSFPDSSEFLVNQLAIASILDRMNKSEEAINELKRGLKETKGSTIPTALSLLILYAQISERLYCNVPVHYRSLLEDIIKWYGIHIPLDLLNDTMSLTKAIIAVDTANREAQERYELLQKELRDSSKNISKKQNIPKLLLEYINRETVKYYRNMASNILERV